MIQLSEAARAKLAKGVGYYVQNISITLTDGTVLNITNEDILGDTGVEIEDATSGSDIFEVGSAIINQCRFTLVNFDGKYDNIDFYDARVQVSIGIPLDDNDPEMVNKGVFYVVEQSLTDAAITLTAYDAMHRFDKPYTLSQLTYPATLAQIVNNACTVCTVVNLALNFPNKDYVVAEKPSDEKVTFREIIAWCAQLAGCYARINNTGALTFGWYDTDLLYDDDAEPGIDYHDVTGVFSRTASASDIEITGVKITVSGESEDESYSVGTEGYVLEFSGNGFLNATNANTFLDFYRQRLLGIHFRKLDVTHLSDPSFEAGDLFRVKSGDAGLGLDVNTFPFYTNDAHLFVSKRGYYYCGLVTYTKFTAGGNQVSRSSAQDKAINQSTRYNSITKLAAETRKQYDDERTEREQAVEQLENELANSPGLYVTSEVQPDQSTIYYTHDKAELEDSTIVWKMTSTAIGISTDGGQTYPYGLDVSGTAILNRIYAIGIDADYINTGRLTVGTGFIDHSGQFSLASIQSRGADNSDVFVRRALFVAYGAEFYSANDNNQPFLDFHREATDPADPNKYDFTARISNSAQNTILIQGERRTAGATPDPCTVLAGAYGQSSDRRLKNRISLLKEDRTKNFILSLKPSKFCYNGSEDVHHGFIYDEVESKKYDRAWVISQMIANLYGDGTSYGVVNINEIVPDIVTVLQSLIRDNEDLKRQIAALTA